MSALSAMGHMAWPPCGWQKSAVSVLFFCHLPFYKASPLPAVVWQLDPALGESPLLRIGWLELENKQT